MTEVLRKLEKELNDIHGILFGSASNIEDLNLVLNDLNNIEEILKYIEEENHRLDNLTNKLIKAYQLALNILSVLALSLSLAGILPIILGIIGFIFFQSRVKKLRSFNYDETQTYFYQKIDELQRNVEYKREITNSRIKRLSKEKKLKLEPAKGIEKEMVSMPKIKMTRVLELK